MNEIFFAGFPIETRRVPGDLLINCKNVTGTLTQLRDFVQNKNSITNTYQFGVRTTEPAYITRTPGNGVKIACLQDSWNNFMSLYRECEARMLN